MPNWCSNTLIATPNPDNIEAAVTQLNMFLDKVNSADSSSTGIFNALVPCPQHILDESAQNEAFPAWYTWRCANWGTKWDVALSDVTFSTASVDDLYEPTQLWFDTAWSPPLPFVERLSILFPLLTFTCAYSEGGCAFAGYDTYENGEVVGCYEVEEVTFEETDDGDCVPCSEWAEFLDEYGLHTGG